MTKTLKATLIATAAVFALGTTAMAASHGKKGSASGETMKKEAKGSASGETMKKEAAEKGSASGETMKKETKGSASGETMKKEVKGSAAEKAKTN